MSDERFSILAPGQKVVLTYQFAAGLDGAETLTGTPTAVVTVEFGTDATPAALVTNMIIVGTDVLVAVDPLIADVDYRIEITCPTSNSQKVLVLAKVLPIRDAALPTGTVTRARAEDVLKMLDSTTESVDMYLLQANLITTTLLGTSTHSADVLALIETFLAAHFAALVIEKGSLAEKTIGEAKEKYHNTYRAGFSSTRFGQQAVLLDTTGVLATASARAEMTNTKKALFTVVTSTAP